MGPRSSTPEGSDARAFDAVRAGFGRQPVADPSVDGPTAGSPGGADPEILVPRRRPIQERSRRKFEALLTSAREVLIEDGIDSFTCEEVASRAGVPIGTLYQFFANKYVLVCELDRQDARGVVAELADFYNQIPTPGWPELLNEFIEHLATMWQSDPSRRAVWLATQATPATRATAAVNEQELARMVAAALSPLTPAADREHRAFMAEVLVHVAYSLLNFSVQHPNDSGSVHEDTVRELKKMLTAYLWMAEREAREEDRNPGS